MTNRYFEGPFDPDLDGYYRDPYDIERDHLVRGRNRDMYGAIWCTRCQTDHLPDPEAFPEIVYPDCLEGRAPTRSIPLSVARPGEQPWEIDLRNLRAELASAKEKNDTLKGANIMLETELKQLKNTLAEKVQQMTKDFKKRTSVRSVYLETTLRSSDQIEGHKTDVWEVGDKKYLVIAEVPRGYEGQRIADDIHKTVTKGLAGMAGVEAAVAIVNEGAKIKVMEVVPIKEDESDDPGQF